MTDDGAKLAVLIERVDGLTRTVDRMAAAQDEIKREMAELRGARKFAVGMLAAFGGAGAALGYAAHKLFPNLPPN